MQRVLVIYDAAGRIWNIVYGMDEKPEGVLCEFVDIPADALLERMDVTDPKHPLPVFSVNPDSELGRMQRSLEEANKKIAEQEKALTDQSRELTDTQMALVEQYEANLALQEEVTNVQLALVEIYEGGGMVL